MASWNGSGENRRSHWEPRKNSSALKLASKPSNIQNQLRANINSIKSRSLMLSQAKSSMLTGFVSAIAVSNKEQNVQMVYDLYTKELRDANTPNRPRSPSTETRPRSREFRKNVKSKKSCETRCKPVESKEAKVFKGRIRSTELSRERFRSSEQKKKNALQAKPSKSIKPVAGGRAVSNERKTTKVSPTERKASTSKDRKPLIPKVQSRKEITHETYSNASMKKSTFANKVTKTHASYSDINRRKVSTAGSDKLNKRHSYADKQSADKMVEIKKKTKWKELLNITERSLLSSSVPTKVVITHTRVFPDQAHGEICLQENVTVKRRIPFKDVNSEFILHLVEMETRQTFVRENVLQLDTVNSESGIGYVKNKRASCKGKRDVPRISYTNKTNILRKVESSPSFGYGFQTTGETVGFDFQNKMIELAQVKEIRMEWKSDPKNKIFYVKHLIIPPLSRAIVIQLDPTKSLQYNSGFRLSTPISATTFRESTESAFYDWPDRPSIFKCSAPRNSRSSFYSTQTPPKMNSVVRKKSSLIFSRTMNTVPSDYEEEEEELQPIELVEFKTPRKSVATDQNLFPKTKEENVKITRQPPVALKPARRNEDTTTTYLHKGANSVLTRKNVKPDLDFEVDQFGNSVRLNHHIIALKRAEVLDKKDMCKRVEVPSSQDKVVRAEPDSNSVKNKKFIFNLFKKKRKC